MTLNSSEIRQLGLVLSGYGPNDWLAVTTRKQLVSWHKIKENKRRNASCSVNVARAPASGAGRQNSGDTTARDGTAIRYIFSFANNNKDPIILS